MALRGTLTHWKTRMLAKALGVMPCHALGILEALWHVTAELAPSGNIGRLPNQAIAMEMFYEGDADKLIEALIDSKHLDKNPTHRLIVHDWSQHVDYNTKRKVERRNESIIANDGKRLVMTRHKSIPVPEPEPVPEPVKKKQIPSREARDERHVPFKEACEAYAKFKGVEFVWDGSEAKQLASLLAASPGLTLETFKRCLFNRGNSVVTQGDRPREWIPGILKYQQGALDQYGKPQGAGNGTSKSDATLAALTRSIQAGRDQTTPGEVRSEETGPDRGGGVRGLLR